MVNLSISVRVLGVDGRPARSAITVWRAIPETDDHPKLPGLDDPWGIPTQAPGWRDQTSGLTWQAIYNYGASQEATLKDLTPGDYCFTAALGNGPSPYGISPVLHLDGTVQHTKTAVILQTGPSLTISAVDVDTHNPIPLFQVLLVRNDGFPVTHWSSASWALWSREQEGRLAFPQLAPGQYHLYARRPALYANQPEYQLVSGPMKIGVDPGVDQQITALLKGTALPEEVVRKRWPFVVTGRVTDQEGHGLEGVTITAHCGMGTLRPTGQTQSGHDGFYTLRFTGGMRTKEGDKWIFGLQAATIGPATAGYVESNLHRQGGLLMADHLPNPDENTGGKAEPGKVVLPERPFRLDFVMVRAATVKGRLVDPNNRPLPGQRIYICGEELPPSTSVLAETRTDTDGRFQCDGIPARRAWWFSLPERDDAKSPPVTFDRSAVYTVELLLQHQGGKSFLELTANSPE